MLRTEANKLVFYARVWKNAYFFFILASYSRTGIYTLKIAMKVRMSTVIEFIPVFFYSTRCKNHFSGKSIISATALLLFRVASQPSHLEK